MAYKASKKKLQFLKRGVVPENVRQSFSPVIDTTPIDNTMDENIDVNVFENKVSQPSEPAVTAENFSQPVLDPGIVVNTDIEQSHDSDTAIRSDLDDLE